MTEVEWLQWKGLVEELIDPARRAIAEDLGPVALKLTELEWLKGEVMYWREACEKRDSEIEESVNEIERLQAVAGCWKALCIQQHKDMGLALEEMDRMRRDMHSAAVTDLHEVTDALLREFGDV